MRVAQLVVERGGGFGVAIRRVSIAVFALIAANVLIGCETESTYKAQNNTGTAAEVGKRTLELSSSEFAADMVSPTGIRVKTNGQYKTDASKKAAADAIDRYWGEVRACAVGAEPPGDTDVSGLIEEFPHRLAVEIADNWKVVE